MTQREKIMARIRALLSKTVDNGCTEDEAITAAAKAAEMLERYNLTRDEVEMRASPFAQDGETFGELVGERMWKIAAAIAHLTSTQYWTTAPGVRPVSINFFGFEHEVLIARYLLEICSGPMCRERDRIIGPCGSLSYGRRRRQAIPFLDGMADRLAQRIRALKPPTPPGTGLIVLHDALIKAAMADAGIGLKTQRSRASRDLEEGYLAGRRAGDRVALNPGVTTSVRPSGLLR